MTFEFREPVAFIKAMSFLHILGPKTHDGGKTITIGTPETNRNGLYSLPFASDVYKSVTMIEVKLHGEGSINSLEYPYCAKIPKPLISIKKSAGPTGMCNSSGINSMRKQYSTSEPWIYCYEISVPTTSQECLYDVVLADPAPAGGTGGPRNVTRLDEVLCPGQTRYISGEPRWGRTDGNIEATVEGYGYYSGDHAMSRDSASLTWVPLPPSMAPVQPTPNTATSINRPSPCPLVTLDFTNLPNPMAR